jgi:hypothetical protein
LEEILQGLKDELGTGMNGRAPASTVNTWLGDKLGISRGWSDPLGMNEVVFGVARRLDTGRTNQQIKDDLERWTAQLAEVRRQVYLPYKGDVEILDLAATARKAEGIPWLGRALLNRVQTFAAGSTVAPFALPSYLPKGATPAEMRALMLEQWAAKGGALPQTRQQADDWLAQYGLRTARDLDPYMFGGVTHGIRGDSGPLLLLATGGLSVFTASLVPLLVYAGSEVGGSLGGGVAEKINPGDAKLKLILETEGQVLGAVAAGAAIKAVGARGLTREQLELYAKRYAEAVNSNKPYTWEEVAPEVSSSRQIRNIRKYARDMGYVKPAPVNELGDADFTGHIYAKDGTMLDEVRLPEELWKVPKERQFRYLNQEYFATNETPAGYTWHHTQTPGKMQLVESGIHSITDHIGGSETGGWAYYR